jgi:hypothetical protein
VRANSGLAEIGVRASHRPPPGVRRSSDVHILKHALALLRPRIADFFRFIDVSESHPFSEWRLTEKQSVIPVIAR